MQWSSLFDCEYHPCASQVLLFGTEINSKKVFVLICHSYGEKQMVDSPVVQTVLF